MFGNLNLSEIIVLAALAYAMVRASKLGSKTALLSLAVGGFSLVNSATASTSTFSGESGSLALSNVNFSEIISWAGLSYGTYLLFRAGDHTGAAAGAAVAIFTIFKSFKSNQTL